MLLALLATPFRRLPFGIRVRSWLTGVDRWLLGRSALARRWAWTVMVEVAEPLPSGFNP
jgi:hypothetical protein